MYRYMFHVYIVYGAYCLIHHLCNITAALSALESKDIFPHNNVQHCPFRHKSLGPFNPVASSSSSQFPSESIVHHFAFFSSSSKRIVHAERE